jgi:hypothetical protein
VGVRRKSRIAFNPPLKETRTILHHFVMRTFIERGISLAGLPKYRYRQVDRRSGRAQFEVAKRQLPQEDIRRTGRSSGESPARCRFLEALSVNPWFQVDAQKYGSRPGELPVSDSADAGWACRVRVLTIFYSRSFVMRANSERLASARQHGLSAEIGGRL